MGTPLPKPHPLGAVDLRAYVTPPKKILVTALASCTTFNPVSIILYNSLEKIE